MLHYFRWVSAFPNHVEKKKGGTPLKKISKGWCYF